MVQHHQRHSTPLDKILSYFHITSYLITLHYKIYLCVVLQLLGLEVHNQNVYVKRLGQTHVILK